MRFCPRCGAQAEENARFCSSCGAGLQPKRRWECMQWHSAQFTELERWFDQYGGQITVVGFRLNPYYVDGIGWMADYAELRYYPEADGNYYDLWWSWCNTATVLFSRTEGDFQNNNNELEMKYKNPGVYLLYPFHRSIRYPGGQGNMSYLRGYLTRLPKDPAQRMTAEETVRTQGTARNFLKVNHFSIF